MPPLLIITALLTIAAAGAWGLIRRSRARMLAEQRATVESERLAAEARLAHEKAMAEAKARDDARQQAEAEERSRKETEARENARLEEKRGLAAEAQGKRLAEEIAFAEAQARETVRLKAEAEARQRAEAEEREKARLVAQEEDLEYRQAQEKARAEAEMRERAQIAAEEEALRQTEEKVAEVNSERGPVSDARPPPNPEKSQESFNRSRVTKIGISEATRRVEPERRAGGQAGRWNQAILHRASVARASVVALNSDSCASRTTTECGELRSSCPKIILRKEILRFATTSSL